MKTKLFFLVIFVCIVQGTFATNIVRTPGSTIDVFTEIPIQGILTADSIYIDGGTGDIYPKAGPNNDGAPYSWDIGTGVLTTHVITFTYANATVTLSDGSKARLISVSRNNPAQDQYVWIIYRNLPLKPTLPSGSTTVCAGSSKNYSSSSTNATSYQWYINPGTAGTLVNGTTGTVTVNWSSSFTGTATLTVKGIKDATESPLSDPLTVTVGTVPTKPVITGDPFVKNGSSIVFTGSSTAATTWTWGLSNGSLATSTPSGNQTTLAFTAVGNLNVTLQASNTCGNSTISNNFAVEIVDITALQSQVTTLTASNATLTTANATLTTVLATRTTERDQALTDKATLQGQVTTLTNTLATRTSERDQALTDKATLQGQVTTLTNTLATRTTERDQALTDKATLQGQVTTLTNDLATRTAERDQTLSDKTTLQGQVTTLTSEKTALQGQVTTLTSEKTTLQGQVITLTSDLATRTSERDAALADKATLQGQVTTLTNTLATRTTERDQALTDKATLQGQVTTLTNTLATRTSERDQALTDKATLQGQVTTLTNTLATRTSERDAALADKATLQGQVTTLTNTLATRTTQRDAALQHVSDIATLLGVSVANIETQINSLKQVYILSWEVTGTTTSVFTTEVGNFSVSLYPNPNPGQVFVSCTEQIKDIKIFNLQGQLLKTVTVNSLTTSFTITRSEMPVGTYIVKIETTKGIATNKLIFQ